MPEETSTYDCGKRALAEVSTSQGSPYLHYISLVQQGESQGFLYLYTNSSSHLGGMCHVRIVTHLKLGAEDSTPGKMGFLQDTNMRIVFFLM